jgi:uncharacterized integral membrane protein
MTEIASSILIGIGTSFVGILLILIVQAVAIDRLRMRIRRLEGKRLDE